MHESVYSRSLKSNTKLKYLTVTLINMLFYSCSNPSVISIILPENAGPVACHTVTNKIQFAQICLWIRSLIMPHSSTVMNLGSNGARTKQGTRARTDMHFIPMIEWIRRVDVPFLLRRTKGRVAYIAVALLPWNREKTFSFGVK